MHNFERMIISEKKIIIGPTSVTPEANISKKKKTKENIA